MRTYIRLFGAIFLLEMILYGIAAASPVYYPVVVFLIAPAFWFGMAISGVRTPWLLWSLVGITITATVYALILSVVWSAVSKNFTQKRRAESPCCVTRSGPIVETSRFHSFTLQKGVLSVIALITTVTIPRSDFFATFDCDND